MHLDASHVLATRVQLDAINALQPVVLHLRHQRTSRVPAVRTMRNATLHFRRVHAIERV